MAKTIYSYIKIVGFISFIPFVLVSGPLGGYFLGDYLEKSFKFKPYITIILILLGFFASISETIKIIRLVVKMDKRD